MAPAPCARLLWAFLLCTATVSQQQFSALPSIFPAKDVVVAVRGNLASAGVATTCQNLTLIRVPVTAYSAGGLGTLAAVTPRVRLPGSADVARPGHWPCTGTAPAGPLARLDLQRSGCGRYLVLTCNGCPVGTTTVCPTQVVARVDWSGAVDTSTSFPSGGVIFTSAYSVDGRGYYVTGFTGAGVRYVAHGGNSSQLLAALTDLNYAHRVLVYMGELYASAYFNNPSLKRGIVAIGSGLAPTSGGSHGVAVIPGRMAAQDGQSLVCMGFEFTSPTRITAACDTSVDGNDYYNYWKPDDALVGSPGRSTFPSLHMVIRWNGAYIFFGTVRCHEAAGQGGCGTRPSGTPGACLPVMSAAAASNCSGYYYLEGNLIDGFDAGSDDSPTNAPVQHSSTIGIGFPNAAGATVGGVAQPPFNPPLEAITVLAVKSDFLLPGSAAPARVLLLSYLARPTALTNWSSGVPLGSPLHLSETLRAGVSSWGATARPHTQGLHDCVVPAWPNATTGTTLARSEDGRYLLLACYSALLTGSLSASARTIVRLAGDGSLPDATVGLLDYPGTPTSVASADGRVLYIGGRGEAGGGGAIRVATWTGARVNASASLLNSSTPVNSLAVSDYTLLLAAAGSVGGWAIVGSINGAPNWQSWQADPASVLRGLLAAPSAPPNVTAPAAVLPQNSSVVWVADAGHGGALVVAAGFNGTAWTLLRRYSLPRVATARGAAPMAATARRNDLLNGNCTFAVYVTTPTHALVFNTDSAQWGIVATAPARYNFQGVAVPAAADLIAPSASPSMTKSHTASASALLSASPPASASARPSPSPAAATASASVSSTSSRASLNASASASASGSLASLSASASVSPTASRDSLTASVSLSSSASPSATGSQAPPSAPASAAPSGSAAFSFTASASVSVSGSPSRTTGASPGGSQSASVSASGTASGGGSGPPSASASASATPSSSPTLTPTPTQSPTGSPAESPSGTAAPSASPSHTPTGSPTQSPTGSPAESPSGTATPSASPSHTPTGTPSLSLGGSASNSGSALQSGISTPSLASSSLASSPIASPTASLTASLTASPTPSPTPSPAASTSPSGSSSSSALGSAVVAPTATQVDSPTASASPTATVSATCSGSSPLGSAAGTPSSTAGSASSTLTPAATLPAGAMSTSGTPTGAALVPSAGSTTISSVTLAPTPSAAAPASGSPSATPDCNAVPWCTALSNWQYVAVLQRHAHADCHAQLHWVAYWL